MALQISAVCYISMSELQTVAPWLNDEFAENNKEAFDKILYDCGMDTRYPYEDQDVQHRNRFGNVITCKRFVGNERFDDQWVSSGYASVEAIDKASGNKLLIDLYRNKGMTESV